MSATSRGEFSSSSQSLFSMSRTRLRRKISTAIVSGAAGNAIRHVHNLVHDPWGNCLWVLTGDYGSECRMRASCDFSRVDAVLQGNQQGRTVTLVPASTSLPTHRSSPTAFTGSTSRAICPDWQINLSSSYGCSVASRVFFSTTVEPSEVNTDRNVRIFGGGGDADWRPLLGWLKDRWARGPVPIG
jgi:hypothetical protein